MHNYKKRFHTHDLLFFVLLTVSFYFTRNTMCRLLMVAFFAYTVVRQLINNKKTPGSFFLVGFFLFIAYGALNILLDNVLSVKVARTMVISLTLNLLMIYAIVQYIYMNKDVSRVLQLMELSIFSATLFVVVLSLGSITRGRLGGGTEMNSNELALLCVYGLILSLYLRKIGKLAIYAYWFKIAFYVLSIVLTGSRKGIIMIALAFVLINYFLNKKKFIKTIPQTVIVLAIGYILIMNVEFLYNIVGVRIENLINLVLDGSVGDGSLKSRQTLIDIGMTYIEKKPWTGYGYDCFKLISGIDSGGKVRGDKYGYYSHNNYIELLFGGGIIGFTLYYIPMVYLLVKLFKSLKKDICIPYLLTILIVKLAIEYAYVSYYSRIDAYVIAVILGCVLFCDNQPQEFAQSNSLNTAM